MQSLVDKLARVRIVLVEPTYDGNLGKVARAMRNFGLSRLVLVGGKADPDSKESRWYARAEGLPVLLAASRVETLGEALAGCRMVIGATRRLGKKRAEPVRPEQLFAETCPWKVSWDTAIMFGREAHGLSTDEIDLCQRLLWIPTDPACPSLNLSHAVVLTGYVLAMAAREDLELGPAPIPFEPASSREIEEMFQHARRVWLRIGYLHYQNPDAILRRWRHVFGRTMLTEYDVRVVRALLHQTEWVARVARIPPGGPLDAPPGLFDKHADRNAETPRSLEEGAAGTGRSGAPGEELQSGRGASPGMRET